MTAYHAALALGRESLHHLHADAWLCKIIKVNRQVCADDYREPHLSCSKHTVG
jgi:hypothetical protein